MPVTKRQGQSSVTAAKERVFAGLFHMNLFVASKRPRDAYFHFDLNAGCGFNHDVDVPGSPLVFADVQQRYELKNVYAHFVDNDRKLVKELNDRLRDHGNYVIHHGDNREFIATIPDLIRLRDSLPGIALGSVLCDPNGMGIHWQELASLSVRCPRLDFIINYSANVWKRERAAGYASDVFLHEHLASLNKKYWHIQEPADGDRLEWMIIVGRNFEMKDWTGVRLQHLASDKGRQALLRTFSYYERNYGLFEDVRELSGVLEASDIPHRAESCHGAQQLCLRGLQGETGDRGTPPGVSGLGHIRHAGKPDRSLS